MPISFHVTIRRAAWCALAVLVAAPAARALPPTEELAGQVTIVRDEYGVPHIDGPTDASVFFGFGYAQAEDYFWQVEDTFIFSLGRYAEIYGEQGLESDLLNNSFEVVRRAKPDYEASDAPTKDSMQAFTEGLNWYLKHHPEVKPRLIDHFEPWMMMAVDRHLMLTFLFGKSHASESANRKNLDDWRGHVGSNGYAIAGSRTKSGKAMLVANPHQPYFGFGQFIEGHLHSGEGTNVAGATFFGSPVISIGHNENLGWTHTVNEPAIGDSWLEAFDDPANPLNYRYDGGWKTATEWKGKVKIKTKTGFDEREYTFRKTHHGPIVGRRDDTHFISAAIAKLYDGNRGMQWLAMGKAHNFAEWKAAMSRLDVPMFNTMYADKDGNIFYVFNGAIPRRDPSFDWNSTVDGTTSKTEWQGLIPFSELPQVLNPPSGFVQNANSTPFTTTDDGSPSANDFPDYMTGPDRNDDKRRAKMLRHLLRQAHDVTYEDWQKIAFDTTLWWPMTELPRYARLLEEIKDTDRSLYDKTKPLLDHLLDWDCKVTLDSTQATLCVEWYSQIYEGFYPAEHFKKQYQNDPKMRFEGLLIAAEKLKKSYGDWKVKWGDVYRIQRHANIAFSGPSDVMRLPFKDDKLSYPLAAAPGPLGEAFTVYFTPPLFGVKNRYAIVGSSFMGAYEFGDKVKASTLLQFGESADPKSPHFMDQSKLMGEHKFKPAWFYWDEVLAHAEAKYHPGEEAKK